eukprot:snap_masked-scaffold_3-processed-gene-17.42-mRNA-1 protein AED:1.00 eAED:1.00 QI:0/0/0/0/1/1/6/0/203
MLINLRQCGGDKNQINPKKFKTGIKGFVLGFQPTKEVFQYCLFHALKSIFVRFILCFPAVKKLKFYNSYFNERNFKDLQKLKNLKLNKLEFSYCNIPEVSSFCSLLKSTNYIKTNSVQNIYKIYLKVYIIEEDIQDKVIISSIKDFLKRNKTIKSLRYIDSQRSIKLSKKDIFELQEIVDSNSSILGLHVYDIFIDHKGKIKG